MPTIWNWNAQRMTLALAVCASALVGSCASGGSGLSSSRSNVIGNSAIEGLEECDDGNTTSGDGCSAAGKIEAGFVCRTAGGPCRVAICEASAAAGEVFMRNNFIEIGMRSSASFGTDNAAPAGYHPRSGQALSTRLGFVANPQDNNWASYDGDFFLPGSPYEAWVVRVGSTNYTNTTLGGSTQITGTFGTPSCSDEGATVDWSGSVAGLGITSTTALLPGKMFIEIAVTLTNTTGSAMTNVYFQRQVDPDNNQTTSGSYDTTNTIVSQPGAGNDVAIVSATQGSSVLALVTIDSRARVYYGGGQPQNAWAGTGVSQSGSVTTDDYVGLVYKFDSIPAGGSVTFRYGYNLAASATEFVSRLQAAESDKVVGVSVSTEAAGANCASGGVRINVGEDIDGDTVPDQNITSRFACNGSTGASGATGLSLAFRATPASSGACPNGGWRWQVGIDDNGSTALDDGEVDATADLCDGLDSLIATSAAPSSACPNGGVRIRAGVDSDGDGALSMLEAPTAQDACNGANALILTSTLPVGDATCSAGGVELTFGTDADADGTLTGGEISDTTPLCKPLNTAFSIVANPNTCANGGNRVYVGIDDNGDGTLTVPGEDDSFADLCTGLDSLILATSLQRDAAACAEGGEAFSVGSDDNGDGMLQVGEIDYSYRLCSGLATALRTRVLAPGADCPTGGVRLETGVDSDGSRALEDGEVQGGQSVCHGANALVISSTLPMGDGTCPGGGLHFDIGVDRDADGALAPSEVSREESVCNGLTTLSSVATITDPVVCPNGGKELMVGTDDDGDGTLDVPGEVDSRATLCNGFRSLTRVTALGSDPDVCAQGGYAVSVGLDADGDGVLDAEEVDGTEVLCAGLNSIARVDTLDPDPAVCPSGGLHVETGLDSDGDGELESGEVSSTQDVCNGLTGLVQTTAIPVGDTTCTAGGVRVAAGIDRDGDGVLGAPETASTQSICQGIDALVRTSTLDPSSSGCARGGVRIESGQDANANGELDDDEVSSSQDVCHGLNSLVEATPLERDVNVCPSGGIRVRVGIDSNGDHTLTQGEVESTEDLCRESAQLVLVTTLAADPAGCVRGGSRVDTGTDTDGNGQLTPNEVTKSQAICNGVSSLTRSRRLESSSGCEARALAVEGGIDTNGNGSLEDAEVVTSDVVCDGPRGFTSVVRTTQLPVDSSSCPGGGILLESGVDANANGVLDPSERGDSNTICDAVEVLLLSEPIEAGDTCAYGGMRISQGHDDGEGEATAGDGELSPSEVESTRDQCYPVSLLGLKSIKDTDSEGCSAVAGHRNAAAGYGRSLHGWGALCGLALVLVRRRRRR